MNTETNRALIAEMYAAAQRGDLDSFFAVMSPDVVVVEPAFLPYGGAYRGAEGLQTLLGEVTQVLDFRALDVTRIVADGNDVLGFLTVPIVDTDSTVELIEHSTIRNGKVAEIRLFFHDLGDLAPLQRTGVGIG